MDKAFSKKCSNDRKDWLSEYRKNKTQGVICLDDIDKTATMNISDFINYELIKFSNADCERSLPSCIDGLKLSQRKIMYAAFKRGLSFKGKSLKVAQLSGYTAEHSNYHHGENNITGTIIGMAHDFPGSNNVPLLYSEGGFGTILEGGKDAADGRYIFTKLNALTELIFRKEDAPLLKSVIDDGDAVQPEFYIPIIPTILVNGCVAGIGTGWSCSVPCYNTLDVIGKIRSWLNKEEFTEDNELVPWYNKWTGSITKTAKNKYVSSGKIANGKKANTLEITELPIGRWVNDFKTTCEGLMAAKRLSGINNYSDHDCVHFILEKPASETITEKDLKLTTNLNTTNMVLFNEKEEIIKYESTNHIIDNFCEVRIDYYGQRITHLLGVYEKELVYLSNKYRFIKEVVENKFNIMNIDESVLLEELKKREYLKVEDSYDYLLRIQVRTFTKDKVAQLENDISVCKGNIDYYRTITPDVLWVNELDELEKAYKAIY